MFYSISKYGLVRLNEIFIMVKKKKKYRTIKWIMKESLRQCKQRIFQTRKQINCELFMNIE